MEKGFYFGIKTDKTIYSSLGDFDIPNNKKLFITDDRCYFLGGQFGYITFEGEVVYISSSTGITAGFIDINENTGYGYCTKKYNKMWVCPYVDDTPLDYPNSMYFQIISYILAIMFKSKQGADVSLLSSQLAMAEQTFEDTLGSDAFQFQRIGNVYR